MGQYQWLIYAILGAVAAAAIAPLGKMGTDQLDSSVVTAVRSLFQAAVVIVAVTLMGRWENLRHFETKSFVYAALTGLAGGVSWLLMFKALSLASVSKVMPIDKLSLPLAILIAVVFQQDNPSAKNWVGIALMVGGAYLAVVKG